MTDIGGLGERKKRRFTRGHPRLTVSFPLELPEHHQYAVTENFGAGGLAFLCPRAFTAGERMRMICANPLNESKLALDAEVVESILHAEPAAPKDDNDASDDASAPPERFTVRVKFIDLHAELKKRIRDFIAEWLQCAADAANANERH